MGNQTYEDYYQKLTPNYDSFNVTDQKCVDKTTLMNWLKYKCALFGFQPVIFKSTKLNGGMWALSISCEYRTKPWRGKDGKPRHDPEDALEIQRKFNGETQAKK